MHHLAITAVYCGFSKPDENTEWEISFEDELSNDVQIDVIELPMLYTNGNCKDNEGYVSVIIPESYRYHYQSIQDENYDPVEIRCYVSVVDVTGTKRFTQSIIFCSHDRGNRSELRLERYVKRDILLNDPDELLPGDCLTLSLDLDFISNSPIGTLYDRLNFEQKFAKSSTNKDPKGSHQQKAKRFYIPLDTDFGGELCRVSDYFWTASHTTMIEGRTRKVRIPEEEVRAFNHMSLIFKQTKQLEFKSIDDIIQLYVVADKYNIQLVIELCRQLIKAFLRTTYHPEAVEYTARIAPEILELADFYRDGGLKDILYTYLESKMRFGTDCNALGILLNEKLETEWNCSFRIDTFGIKRKLAFNVIQNDFEFYH